MSFSKVEARICVTSLPCCWGTGPLTGNGNADVGKKKESWYHTLGTIPIAVEASIQFLTAGGAELAQSQVVTGANGDSYVGSGMVK